MLAAGLFAVLFLLGPLSVAGLMAAPFQPVRGDLGWYTDRRLIDIEIVGSTSLLPNRHQLEPGRVLRFRLERAYVQNLVANEGPGFEIVDLGIDMETGLPLSVVQAVSMAGRFHEDIPGVPYVSHSDQIRRTLLISIQSDLSNLSLERGSVFLSKCRGQPIGNGLVAYEWEGRSGCQKSPSWSQGMEYLAIYDNELLLKVQCKEEPPKFPMLGCDFRFPFEAFSVQIRFHRDHLPRWRELVRLASEFLSSKQYHEE